MSKSDQTHLKGLKKAKLPQKNSIFDQKNFLLPMPVGDFQDLQGQKSDQKWKKF